MRTEDSVIDLAFHTEDIHVQSFLWETWCVINDVYHRGIKSIFMFDFAERLLCLFHPWHKITWQTSDIGYNCDSNALKHEFLLQLVTCDSESSFFFQQCRCMRAAKLSTQHAGLLPAVTSLYVWTIFIRCFTAALIMSQTETMLKTIHILMPISETSKTA